MTILCSVKDRELNKFVECPDGSGKVAVRTKICQNPDEAIKVDMGTKGTTENIFNDVSSVPINIETLVVTYTAPIGKAFDLSGATCSGDNIAKFTAKINGINVQVKRTWWTRFNEEFKFLELILNAGDKIEIFVENKGKGVADFEATIIGGEYNV